MTSQHMRKLIADLAQWQLCMSYNDSYFGEPPGQLKQTIRQMVKEIEAEDRAAASTVTAAEYEHECMVKTLQKGELSDEEKAFYSSLIGPDK